MSAKLLIVDDEDVLLESLKSYLERKGYSVFAAKTGDMGLELLKQHNPELMLLDLHLKEGITGIETLRQVILIKPDLKIAMLTGFSQDKEAEKTCLNMGAKLFLTKPIRLSVLKEELDKLATL